MRIFKTYGHQAIQVMTEDPYRLAKDVRGIGFKTADAIAAKLGMEKTAPQRIRAGISFALQTATDEGHCALPVEALTRLADVGLDADQFVKVVEFAPRTRPDRYTILEHLVMKPDEIHRKLAEYVDALAER